MYTHAKFDAKFENNILSHLSDSWNNRVAVRRERLNLQQYYDPSIPDFPITMVPFWDDLEFRSVSEKEKIRVLVGAWISYNEKTIYIEDRIINPLCALLMVDDLPGVSDPTIKQVLAQTMVDEQFHILMCLEVCNCARLRHNMQDFRMLEPLLGQRVKVALAGARNARDYALIRMAYGTVAEMTINAYLKQLSTDETIQPLNRLNTDLHRKDEGAHAAIFAEVVRSVYRNLPVDEQICFNTYIVRALTDFVEMDLTFWKSILDYLAIPGRLTIIEQLASSNAGVRTDRDYTAFLKLLDDLGIRHEVDFAFKY